MKPDSRIFVAGHRGLAGSTPSRPSSSATTQTNVIHSAWRHGTTKLCFLGSSCIYPKLAPQPLKEEYLLTGPLEPTNEWYAVRDHAEISVRDR